MLILLAVAAVGVGYWYVIRTRWNQYNEWEGKIEENVKRVKEARRKARQLDSLIEEVREFRRKLKKAQRKLPEKGEFFDLLANLEQEATASGIPKGQISNFSRGSVRSKKMVKARSINAEFERITLGALARLLWQYNNMERLIDIQTISIQPQQDANRFNVSLQLAVYILKEQSSGGEQ